MFHETLPTIDDLNRMDDLSGAALYHAEVQRIPFLSREQQADYVGAAQAGDTDATHALILNCLNWVRRRARAIYRDREPQHTDVMDLVGTANMRMLEVMPNALHAADPVSYLMTVSSNAKLDAVLEGINSLPTREDFHRLEQRLDTLESDVKVIKTVVGATNRDLDEHKQVSANVAHGHV
jgi:hypothetical protein